MTRAFHGQFLGVVALVAATVVACGGGSDQPSPRPATTPAPPVTSTSTATAASPPTATPTTAIVSTCVLWMDGDKDVTATFTELSTTRCATPTDADCVLAVYLGAPGDYAQAVDIPAEVLLAPAADGRYYVERGQQYTVVTAAPLPEGWTRFWLEWSPLEFGTPSPISASQLIKPVGTTYTFTVTEDEAAPTLITFDLKQARPFVRPRPDNKPEIGDTVVTTVFSVATTAPRCSSYDTTGAVATAGSYAFLSDPDDTSTAVTTYEALRDGTTTALLIHKADAHGASQAALYDTVEAGDLFEWHEADDCFVRYRVTNVPAADPAAVHREFGVRWETYVFQGCQTGSVPTSATVTFTAGADPPLEHLGGTSLTDFAVVHGPWQLTQATQSEPGALGNPPAGIAVKQPELTEQPVQFQTPSQYDIGQTLTSLTDIRQLPYWREPTLPPGWMLSHVRISGGNSPEGYEATYSAPGGRYPAVSIRGMHAHWRHLPEAASWLTSHDPPRQVVQELHAVAGRPAIVDYSPSGGQHLPSFPVSVRIYDPSTQCIYEVVGRSGSLGLLGGPAALERLLAIATSLFESPNAP